MPIRHKALLTVPLTLANQQSQNTSSRQRERCAGDGQSANASDDWLMPEGLSKVLCIGWASSTASWVQRSSKFDLKKALQQISAERASVTRGTEVSTARYKVSIIRRLIEAERECIPTSRRQSKSPTIPHWILNINDIHRIEELTSAIRDKTAYFITAWSGW